MSEYEFNDNFNEQDKYITSLTLLMQGKEIQQAFLQSVFLYATLIFCFYCLFVHSINQILLRNSID